MKKFLFIFIAAAALLLTGCKEKNVQEAEELGPARLAWQLSIYHKTVACDYLGFVEEENDSATVEALIEEAASVDSLETACLVVWDCAGDTVIDIFDLK
jgi:hypothetical protein